MLHLQVRAGEVTGSCEVTFICESYPEQMLACLHWCRLSHSLSKSAFPLVKSQQRPMAQSSISWAQVMYCASQLTCSHRTSSNAITDHEPSLDIVD